jgi:hypothetical protein
VVYLLCEARKLLDKYPPNPMPFALKLYCHWAPHVDLTHTGTTLPFLKKVDGFVAGAYIGGEPMNFAAERRRLDLPPHFKILPDVLISFAPSPGCRDDSTGRGSVASVSWRP